MIILGIDPGTSRTGYGLIKQRGEKLQLIKSGLLKISEATDKNQRLVDIEKSFSALLKKERPNLAAIEKIYFAKNRKTAIDVAQCRGVLTFLILKHKIPLLEYNPSQIKACLTGYGLADKKSVAKMVSKILKTEKIEKIDDASDALAIAIT